MRRICLAFVAVAALLSFTALAPNHANAVTLPAPAAVNGALADHKLTEEVAYVCRRVCGRYGCARRCWWTGGPRYYRPYYRPYRPYGYYRPYRYYRW